MGSTDVLIVGAGAAGLAASRVLTRAGLHVTILEARARLGGRIHTIHDPLCPVPVELGAEFVHGKAPGIWTQVESGRLPAVEIRGAHLFVDGGEAREDGFEDTEALLAGMAGAPEQSFRDFLDRAGARPETRRSAVAYIEGFNAARQELISVRSLALAEEAAERIEGHRSFRLTGGYSSLVDWMWSGIDPERSAIHLSTAVDAIEWRRGAVSISAQGRRYTAPRAIVTIPLGVLQAGAVRFTPEPPALREALGALEMGCAIRIILRFRRPFWEHDTALRDASFLHTGDAWMPVWWTALPVHAPVLTGWCGGPRAEAAPEDPADWLTGALASLARLTGKDAELLAGELESWHAHNWSLDPFARGAYSYVRVGGLAAQERFGEPVEDTLYFAGEAVHSEGHFGMVHGAIGSGERAARLIVSH